jgi:hypothetical protein
MLRRECGAVACEGEVRPVPVAPTVEVVVEEVHFLRATEVRIVRGARDDGGMVAQIGVQARRAALGGADDDEVRQHPAPSRVLPGEDPRVVVAAAQEAVSGSRQGVPQMPVDAGP